MLKLYKKWKSISYYGFPVAHGQKSESKNKGIALLIAMLTIVMMVGLVSDMILSSSVNIQLAVAHRDRIRAEYLAKSGFNFASFLLSISWGIDLYRAQPDAMPMIKKELSDDASSLWNLVNKLPPIGAMTVELVQSGKNKVSEEDEGNSVGEDPFQLKGIMNEAAANTMKLFESSFSMKIIDESSKINVNECSNGLCLETIQMLTALFSCPAEKAFLESKNLRPEELAYRIKDFISSSTSTSSESGFSDKNAPYQKETPPYSAKSLPLDTVDELKLIAGWDDEVHDVFAPYLTAFRYPQAGKNKFSSPININTVKTELLGCLVPTARSSNCAENYAQQMYKIKKENATVFQGSIESTLKTLTCLDSDPSALETGGQTIDPKTWFDKKSSVFRIEITANTGDQERKLIAVIQRMMPGQKKTKEQTDAQRSFQILYWKLI